MYEIFFFDIDGTLRSFETQEVPASAREALARLRERGAKVIIATGRDRRSLPPLEGMTFDGYVLVNGGHCLTAEGEVLAERLREHRARCNMTQEFVAEALGVSRQAVSKWETGATDPSTANLIALAKLYGVPAQQLLEGL